jgi:putative proteasome-type protease
MTYCLALKLDEGMVFASDSRTNAGIDQISCFKKMRTFVTEGDRAIVTMSSGNLSVTQSAFNLLEQRSKDPNVLNIWNATSMFDVATLLGECLLKARTGTASLMSQSGIDMGANFILGGQINGEPPRLFLVYSEGNFIEATDETPYFQIGETKYGKPILDRFIQPDTSLTNAIKCTIVSFDSTMRSNVSVGLPIDLASIKRDALALDSEQHITEADPYFSDLTLQWRNGLKTIFDQLPEPHWVQPEAPITTDQVQQQPSVVPIQPQTLVN